MEWEQIRKRTEDYLGANLLDYEQYSGVHMGACSRAARWTARRRLNIAHEAVDRHILSGRGEKLALRWIGRDDSIRDISYSALGSAANRFANVLAERGITKGDRVFSLLGRTRNFTPPRSARSRMAAYFRRSFPRLDRNQSRPA